MPLDAPPLLPSADSDSTVSVLQAGRAAPPAAALPVGWPLLALTTWFGSGLIPFAPGTMGSIAALPFAWAIAWAWGPWALVPAAALVFVIGTLAAEAHVRRSGEKDPQRIVIDEVAGQWLTLAVAPLDPLAYGVGLVLFRICDITKPWPACWADRSVPGGFGVMLDDGIAAVYSTCMMALYVHYFM
ncbi:phosphatidylglycerophosphatase A [Rhodospirillum rubrum]|uniref:phosphatidylglycerophosphatase A family protein n=1 Tax=Rhodospirillum rubrum TaxID=1085 RepID=UPI001904DF0A|nr:phosphatidylglycerophosphatase A [Rhodospirillum rubrum]MBK1664187.1 phosphatidylglycerophosphatase A [Rhodospirillum rubrum]MBK1675792.1 phosphatidylglycerophosphatase A [Rhodospirillum rubrum]